jgi:hypothetical protein
LIGVEISDVERAGDGGQANELVHVSCLAPGE